MSNSYRPTVATVLDPDERIRVEAVGTGCFSVVHRDSVREAIRVVREQPVDAMLVSLSCCSIEARSQLERFNRAFPGVPTVALMTRSGPGHAQALLRLGATGVRQVIDASAAEGWRRLREVLGAPPPERAKAILLPVFEVTGSIPPGARRFWEELVTNSPNTTTVRTVAIRLGVQPSTMVSRFGRAGLPSPKDHLVAVRLCHAAQLFDEGELTVADVAYRLDYASPQSFGRHLRCVMGITPTEFRNRFPFGMVLDRFLDTLVRPHAKVWQSFRPLAPGKR